jgi:hypothetical protein
MSTKEIIISSDRFPSNHMGGCRRLLNLMWWDSETQTESGSLVKGIWDMIRFGTWVGFDSGPEKCDWMCDWELGNYGSCDEENGGYGPSSTSQ